MQRDEGRIVVFQERLILEAQPPVGDLVLSAIEARCAGPLPEDLVALWRAAFGGEVDYDLSIWLGDHAARFSFRELFYPGSNRYDDLWGWMGRQLSFEQEAAEAAGEVHDGQLRYLPFGGFEYLDRLFVDVTGGPHHGSVVAWMQGLPPAWRLRLHEDSSARIAPDVRSLFRMLILEDDPFAPSTDYPSGGDAIEAIEALEDADEAERLSGLLRAAVLDWRAAVADGSAAHDVRARRVAWRRLCSEDEVALLDRLLALGCDPEEVIAGSGRPIELAVQQGACAVLDRLLERGVDVAGTVAAGASSLPAARLLVLLERGAEVDDQAVLASASSPDPDVTELLVATYLSRTPAGAADLAARARASANRQRESADRVASGQMGSNWTPERYRALADRLDGVAGRLGGR